MNRRPAPAAAARHPEGLCSDIGSEQSLPRWCARSPASRNAAMVSITSAAYMPLRKQTRRVPSGAWGQGQRQAASASDESRCGDLLQASGRGLRGAAARAARAPAQGMPRVHCTRAGRQPLPSHMPQRHLERCSSLPAQRPARDPAPVPPPGCLPSLLPALGSPAGAQHAAQPKLLG